MQKSKGPRVGLNRLGEVERILPTQRQSPLSIQRASISIQSLFLRYNSEVFSTDQLVTIWSLMQLCFQTLISCKSLR